MQGAAQLTNVEDPYLELSISGTEVAREWVGQQLPTLHTLSSQKGCIKVLTTIQGCHNHKGSEIQLIKLAHNNTYTCSGTTPKGHP